MITSQLLSCCLWKFRLGDQLSGSKNKINLFIFFRFFFSSHLRFHKVSSRLFWHLQITVKNYWRSKTVNLFLFFYLIKFSFVAELRLRLTSWNNGLLEFIFEKLRLSGKNNIWCEVLMKKLLWKSDLITKNDTRTLVCISKVLFFGIFVRTIFHAARRLSASIRNGWIVWCDSGSKGRAPKMKIFQIFFNRNTIRYEKFFI
jgi:hypothetical protein